MPSATKNEKQKGAGVKIATARSHGSATKTASKSARPRASAAAAETGKSTASKTSTKGKTQAPGARSAAKSATSAATRKTAAKSAQTSSAKAANVTNASARTTKAAAEKTTAGKSAARAAASVKNSAARGGATKTIAKAEAKAAVASTAKAEQKTTARTAAKAVRNAVVSSKAPVDSRKAASPAKPASAAKGGVATPPPAKPTQMKAAPAKTAAPILSTAAAAPPPAPTPVAPNPARDSFPASPAPGSAPSAGPAASGKISSTTTAGEDKKLAKRNEPPVTTATPVAEKTPFDTKAVAKPTPAVAAKAKPAAPKHGFKLNEFIVYPAHGVGQIIGMETQEVAGFSLELFVVSFIKDKMILKVPTSKVANVGMRKLAEGNVVDKALGTLSGRARIKRTMWSRRAQEYEAKINSGDLVTIAEVVRDLYRSDTQPEQSYSERQLYEAALDRMAREVAAVRKLIDSEALKLIESFLQKGPRRGQKADADLPDDADDEDVDRAA